MLPRDMKLGHAASQKFTNDKENELLDARWGMVAGEIAVKKTDEG